MKIKVVVPVTTKEFEIKTRDELKSLGFSSSEMDVEGIEYGTASIESRYDELLCVPGIIKLCEKAQVEGYEGIFISCMFDPAVEAVREKLDIPIVGPCRTSMLLAADLAEKFSVVTVTESSIPLFYDIAKCVGIESKLASVRSVDIPVLELANKEKLKNALVRVSIDTIEKDGAHCIILGCTGMLGVDQALCEGLSKKGYNVPVIYPVPVSIRYLEMLISLRLTHSKKTYMYPSNKERNIWDVL